MSSFAETLAVYLVAAVVGTFGFFTFAAVYVDLVR